MSPLTLESLPAEPAAVAAYLAELADPPDDRAPLAMSTIERRVAALGEAHKAAASEPLHDPAGEAGSSRLPRLMVPE